MLRFLSGYLVLTVLISLTACTSENKEKQTSDIDTTKISPRSDSIQSAIPQAGTVNGDTIILSGKYVLFYAPADEKGDASINKFKDISTVVIDSLKKARDLNVAFTTASNIKIYLRSGSVIQFSTAGFTDKKGIVVTDGLQPPTIKKGLLSLQDYHAFIKKYFMRP